jgi:hypothetical protein
MKWLIVLSESVIQYSIQYSKGWPIGIPALEGLGKLLHLRTEPKNVTFWVGILF